MGKQPDLEGLPVGTRLVVPVLAATGGAGRSTVSSLLAGRLGAVADTVVMDLADRLSSPWPAVASDLGAAGLASVAPDRPVSRAEVRAAGAAAPGRWAVLADARPWDQPPLVLPEDPAAWYQLAAVGGWQAVVADLPFALAHDVAAARHAGGPSQTRRWCDLPYAVPVVCAAATAAGVQAVQQAVTVLSAENLPLRRCVVVFVGTADGRLPAVVRAAATMLSPLTAAVLHVPHDSEIRAHGLRGCGRAHARTQKAAAEVASAVLAAAHATWGEPLPAAAVPVPLPVPAVSAAAPAALLR
ncbi:hypothetical protein ACWCQL_13265 [Streptomyces sp. NPDC002073]